MQVIFSLYISMALAFIGLFYFVLPKSFGWIKSLQFRRIILSGFLFVGIIGLVYTYRQMKALPDPALFVGKFQLIESFGFIPERLNDYHEFNVDSSGKFSFNILPEIRACDSGTYRLVQGKEENYLIMNCGTKKDSAVIRRSLFRLQLGFFRKDRVHPSIWFEKKLFENQSKIVTN